MSDSTLRSRSPSSKPCPDFTTPASLIWSFFRDAQDDEVAFVEIPKGRKARNRYCLECETGSNSKSSIFCTPWTSNAKQHLLKKHNVDIDASKNTS